MVVYEDNEGSILVLENGYSPALRHMLKTQKVSIDLLHQIIHVMNIAPIEKIETDKQVADIFTKSLVPQKWEGALALMRVERSERVTGKRM